MTRNIYLIQLIKYAHDKGVKPKCINNQSILNLHNSKTLIIYSHCDILRIFDRIFTKEYVYKIKNFEHLIQILESHNFTMLGLNGVIPLKDSRQLEIESKITPYNSQIKFNNYVKTTINPPKFGNFQIC